MRHRRAELRSCWWPDSLSTKFHLIRILCSRRVPAVHSRRLSPPCGTPSRNCSGRTLLPSSKVASELDTRTPLFPSHHCFGSVACGSVSTRIGNWKREHESRSLSGAWERSSRTGAIAAEIGCNRPHAPTRSRQQPAFSRECRTVVPHLKKWDGANVQSSDGPAELETRNEKARYKMYLSRNRKLKIMDFLQSIQCLLV